MPDKEDKIVLRPNDHQDKEASEPLVLMDKTPKEASDKQLRNPTDIDVEHVEPEKK